MKRHRAHPVAKFGENAQLAQLIRKLRRRNPHRIKQSNDMLFSGATLGDDIVADKKLLRHRKNERRFHSAISTRLAAKSTSGRETRKR